MNLQQLEYIVALDKHKSFSLAAESCFITQATLSTMVKKLEEEFDMVIFDRKTSPIITTEVGKNIINEAKKALFHTHRLKQMSTELKGKIEGELKIGIIPTIASNLLHRVLPVLLDKYPKLKLSIQEITTSNIIKQLKTGTIDVGIVSTPLNINEFEEDVLYYEKLQVYGHIKLKNVKYLQPKDISNEKIWLMEQGNCLTDQIINVCSLNYKKINPNLNFQPNSFESLINIVDHLKGVTLIPEMYVLDLPETRKKYVKDFVAPFPVREISLIYHRPFAKLNSIGVIGKEIKKLIAPNLKTYNLKKSEMVIAKI
jgi:LysR family hydrogen peroxide-inducible transcriptional activator